MNTRKRDFVPSDLARLEDRVVLSHGPQFTSWGAAILTGKAYNKAAADIQHAFQRFATDGLNYGRLAGDLGKAVSVIPYNFRDGLVANMNNEVRTLAVAINFQIPGSVVTCLGRAEADLNNFVRSEIAVGKVVIR